MDGCHYVLDDGDLSDRLDYERKAWEVVGDSVECRIRFGMGIGYIVSDSDFVGACAFEVGEGIEYVTLFRKKRGKKMNKLEKSVAKR
jgi:hypothetical protein